ncbi:RnfABCDGE type electron transport complex subunit G [Tissierellaceae bacterium HCP3S3_D8]
MNETIKLGLVLLIITAVAGGILAFSNEVTAPIIAEIQKQGTLGALMEIFPDAEDVNEIDEALLEEIKANNKFVTEVNEILGSGEEVIGYSLKTVSGGYGGDIATITGIYSDGTLAGIKVVENSETPGLGTRIEGTDFTDSFKGKATESELTPVASPSADNEVQLLSGATVSTNGVLAGVNGARDAFVNYLSK